MAPRVRKSQLPDEQPVPTKPVTGGRGTKPEVLPEMPVEVWHAFHGTIDGMLFELPIEVTDMVAARDVLRELMPKGTVLDVYFNGVQANICNKPCDRVRITVTFTASLAGHRALQREVVVG